MIITINNDFKENAIYPIIVDPTLGFSSQGGTVSNLAGDTIRISSSWTMPEPGIIRSLSFYSKASLNIPHDETFGARGVVYNNNNDVVEFVMSMG